MSPEERVAWLTEWCAVTDREPGEIAAFFRLCEQCKGKGMIEGKEHVYAGRRAKTWKHCKYCAGKGVPPIPYIELQSRNKPLRDSRGRVDEKVRS